MHPAAEGGATVTRPSSAASPAPVRSAHARRCLQRCSAGADRGRPRAEPGSARRRPRGQGVRDLRLGPPHLRRRPARAGGPDHGPRVLRRGHSRRQRGRGHRGRRSGHRPADPALRSVRCVSRGQAAPVRDVDVAQHRLRPPRRLRRAPTDPGCDARGQRLQAPREPRVRGRRDGRAAGGRRARRRARRPASRRRRRGARPRHDRAAGGAGPACPRPSPR